MIKFYINLILLLSIFSFHPFVKDLYCSKYGYLFRDIPEEPVEELKDDEFSNNTIDALLTLHKTEFRQVANDIEIEEEAGHSYIGFFHVLYRNFRNMDKKDLIFNLPKKRDTDSKTNVVPPDPENEKYCKVVVEKDIDDENLQILFQVKVIPGLNNYDNYISHYAGVLDEKKKDSNFNYLKYLKAVIKFTGYYTKDVLLKIVDGTLKKEDATGFQVALFDILGTPEDTDDKMTIYGRMKKIMGKSRFSLEDLKTMINDHKFLFTSGHFFLPMNNKFYITVLKDKSVFDYVPNENKTEMK